MQLSRIQERARYAVRWLASMVCFIVFGLGGLLFGLLLVPLVTLATPSRPRRVRRLRWWLQQTFRAFVWLMSASRGATFEVIGALPARGNYLIIANHPTVFDAVVLLALLPQADCIIKHELLRNPFMRFALSGLDFISNADTAEMLDCAVERLRSGRNLVVFPEGTRSRPGEPVRFKLAAAAVAVRAGVPCVPVIVRCDPPTRAKEGPWYEIAPERPHHSVEIGAPFRLEDIVGSMPTRYAKRVLNEFLQRHYNEALAIPRASVPSHALDQTGHYSPLA